MSPQTAPPPDAAASTTATDAPLLQTTSLTRTFRQGTNTVTALADVSLSVGRGEFVAVMGASGSGKSTLLHLIGGLTRPDSGSVHIDEVEITSLRDPQLTWCRRQKIGFVFQSFNLIPTLTTEQNILLPVLSGGKQGSLSVEALLDRVGLQDRRSHRPDALSGGEQQRVAIARALITDPALVLADEPTGSLDSATGQSICRLLKDLTTELGRTVVVVTHEPAVALWADRVVVLRDGRKLTEFETSGFADALALAAHYHEVTDGTSAAEESR